MGNEKKIRLIRAAKEFNVGLSSITDFLHRKGIEIDSSPNTPIDADTYAILEKEFGKNRPSGSELDSVREKMNKKSSVSIEPTPAPAPQPKEEKRTIEVKDEFVQPKVLGKIDLTPKKKVEPAPAPKAEPVKVEEKKETPKVEPKAAPAPQVEEKPAPKAESAKVEEPKVEPKSTEVFRATEAPSLAGPQILGTMDVSGMVAGGKRHRKRLDKAKVDISKQQFSKGDKKNEKNEKFEKFDKNNKFNKQNNNQNQQNQGGGKKNKQKPQPKPVVRPEVSDEEVSKQIKDTLARLTAKGAKNKGAKYRREKREEVRERMNEAFEQEAAEKQILKVTEFVTVSEVATMMNVSPMEVISACMNLVLMVSINLRLDAVALVVVAVVFGFSVEFLSAEIQEAINDEDVDAAEDLLPRPPIVTVMGHVDHGKTSLLDNIRKTNVTAGEAGGITQHIGAYSVNLNGQKITFLDTPGHEAFTAMRARGAKITDVAVIIVAADDKVMPQTVEAINHAQAAGVPMVFAINKIDKPQANPDHIKEQLSQMNLLVEDWGGKYQSQDVSAKQGLNLDKLLEKVLLEAEMLDLKANPNKKAKGTIIESTLDKGRGYVSTVLVQEGTLRVGDVILSGVYTGRVKAMFDENGNKVKEAGPSTPVQLLGLNGAPQAGDSINVMDDDRSAREIANKREQLQRMQGIMTQKHVTLDEIGRRIAIGSFKELNIIVKGDVDGSVEAMSGSLIKLSKETVQVNVIHSAVGQISESDVLLAAASNAIIVGFQVRPSAAARKVAEQEEIEIRLYSIIYDAINDIKDAIEGMLEPVMKEEIVCSVEVLETFKISKVGTIAGGIVREGKITRNTPVRVIRDGIVIHTGRLGSLKRFKDDVKEVTSGMDCGLNIESYNDIKIGDIIEGYEQVEVKRK
ncbi:MAG: translation initiation factor IF-2 [Alistipes sp.]|nr:translation initiation factor IF-2 [Alistipes sp.]